MDTSIVLPWSSRKRKLFRLASNHGFVGLAIPQVLLNPKPLESYIGESLEQSLWTRNDWRAFSCKV